MRPERWQAIEELYHSALDLPDGQRDSFLQEACGEDQSLLYEVESLIRHGSIYNGINLQIQNCLIVLPGVMKYSPRFPPLPNPNRS